jgi:hypothetical protein
MLRIAARATTTAMIEHHAVGHISMLLSPCDQMRFDRSSTAPAKSIAVIAELASPQVAAEDRIEVEEELRTHSAISSSLNVHIFRFPFAPFLLQLQISIFAPASIHSLMRGSSRIFARRAE